MYLCINGRKRNDLLIYLVRQENKWLLVTIHASSAAGLYVSSSSQLFSNAVLPLSVLTLYTLYQYAYSPYCSLHKL